ncbi:MAG: porin [Parasphingorhabdus sp.]|mgnify:CR=1 FL=1|uniref:OprO/OprP family phosphate-selective porin n=1 Tax=Parasphingorhabdus sp. TaxID=2709688 RepID=UPI00300376B6|tara:strand:+ start:9596 stop:10753 length:1158 start_codon:yes stop_codon:yes gene_type:complete
MKKLLFMGSAISALIASPAYSQDVTADEKGLTIEGDDFELVFGGRLHLDTVSVNDDITIIPSRTDIRRLRIDATLTIADDFRIKVDRDIGGLSTGWKNLWAEYRGIDNLSLKAGQMTVPFNGEDMKSSNDLKLMERGLPSALAPNFAVGGSARYRGKNWSVTGGYFGNPLGQDPIRATDQGRSIVGRAVFAPIDEREQAIHLAGAIEYRKLKDLEPSKVSAQPEFGLSGITLIRTGSQPDVQSYMNYNIEAGYMNGPFLIQGQYIMRKNDAPLIGDPTYKGASVEAAFVLTGERQRYSSSSGTFGGIRPQGKFGAVEIAARYSTLDLTDGPITGGKQSNYSVGLNWYITQNLRVMANYVNAKTRPNRNGINENVNAFMGRFQIAF